MVYILALLASYLPALLWLAFFYSQDRYQRQPKRLVATLFLLGIGATAPTVWINQFLQHSPLGSPSSGSGWLIVFALAALTEETAKYLFAASRVADDRDLREPVDGMIYLTTVALGFAAAESTTYIINEYLGVIARGGGEANAFSSAFLGVAPQRALLTAIGHVTWSGIVGYYAGRRLLGTAGWISLIAALIAASVLHAAFNTAASGRVELIPPELSAPLSLLVWLGGVAAYAFLFARSLDDSPFRKQQLRARLRGLPLFADLPPSRLEAAADQLSPQRVRRGDVVVREGEPADRFYIIASGDFVAMQGHEGDGGLRTLRHMRAGEVFGQIGILTGSPRTATVQAQSDGLLLALDAPAFLRLVDDDPIVVKRLLDVHRGAATAELVGATLRSYAASEGKLTRPLRSG